MAATRSARVRSADVLGAELGEAAPQAAHDGLNVDDLAAFEVALILAVFGDERGELSGGATFRFIA